VKQISTSIQINDKFTIFYFLYYIFILFYYWFLLFIGITSKSRG